jgi:membrane protease YdiL (CAAX protease family)
MDRRQILWLEFAALVAWDPLSSTVYGLLSPRPAIRHFSPSYDIVSIFSRFGAVAILCFLLCNSGDELSLFGFRRFQVVRDIAAALALAGAMYVCFDLPRHFAHGGTFAIHPNSWLFGVGIPAILLAVLATMLGAAYEEILFRGTFIPRLEELTGNVWLGVLISALLFSLVHVYQGLFGVFVAFAMGLLFGVGFVRLRSLWPLVIAHALSNLIIYLGL